LGGFKREPLFVGWTLTIPQLPLGGLANAALLRLFLKDHQPTGWLENISASR